MKTYLHNPEHRALIHERIMSRVEPDLNSGCWLWSGALSRGGYGHIVINRVSLLAHRVSAEIASGESLRGAHILHRCDTPSCVNPDHLSVGTRKENMQDAARKGRIRGRGGYSRVSPRKAYLMAQSADRIGVRATSRLFHVDPATVRRAVKAAPPSVQPVEGK